MTGRRQSPHMTSVAKIHKESGETGKFGESFIVLGVLFLLLGGAVIAAPFYVFSTWNASPEAAIVDGLQSGMLYAVAGLGFTTFGAMAIMSGWGRHHPKFDAGGDPDVADEYDPEGR